MQHFLYLEIMAKAEMQRHNLAMEKLSKAREDWNRERQQRLDFDQQDS